MIKVELKKIDISRLIVGLSLLHIDKQINDNEYKRLHWKLFKLLK